MTKHKLYDSKLFWKTKNWFKVIKHKRNVFRYRLIEKVALEREKISFSNRYFLGILFNVFRAILFVTFLYFVEYFSQNIIYSNIEKFPDWVLNAIEFIPKPKYPNDVDSVNGFISLIASVSGVLLALFYPILATIASTAYSKVNSNIRNLLFIEPVTQNYLKKLAFLTAYSVCVLLLIIFDYFPGNLILLILTFLCLVSLFNLLKLGAGVYKLFEPETLANILVRDISKDIKQVTTKRANWNNQSFQVYFRKKVEKKVETLRLLNELSFEGISINRQSILNTISSTFDLLKYYYLSKNLIPKDSNWFKQKYKHKSYFEGSLSDKELFSNMNNYIRPEEEKDVFWFEKEIFKIYGTIGIRLTMINDLESISEYIKESNYSFLYYGNHMEIDVIEKLMSKNFAIIKSVLLSNNNKTYKEQESKLIIIEHYISTFDSYISGFLQRIELTYKDFFNSEINKINWKRQSTLYDLTIPNKLIFILEKYFQDIKNERFIEGEKITPNWYIIQHLSAEYLLIVKESFSTLFLHYHRFILPLIKTTKSKENHLLTSFLSHLSLGTIPRIEYLVKKIEKITEKFKENDLYKNKFNWNTVSLKESTEKTQKIRKILISHISDSLPNIINLKWNSSYPDVFAQSFSIISRELNNSLTRKDIKRFKELFNPFLLSSLGSFFSLYDRYQNKFGHKLEISHQVHIEVMELCGLAYIYSELYDIPFWPEIVDSWNNQKLEQSELKILIMSYIYFQNRGYGVSRNYSENNTRKKELFKTIREERINPKDYEQNIIYPYLKDEMLRNSNYSEIFIEMYLFTFLEAKDTIKNLPQSIERKLFKHIEYITK